MRQRREACRWWLGNVESFPSQKRNRAIQNAWNWTTEIDYKISKLYVNLPQKDSERF